MDSLIIALIPLLEQLFDGTEVSVALNAITFAQWVTIGAEAIKAGPEVMKALSALHPAFDRLMADLAENRDPTVAAGNLRAWLSSNADAAIRLQPGISGQ